MELVAFSIQRYRSIVKTPKLPLRGMTVLVGPNNEGKSNIVQALTVGLRLLQRFGMSELQPRAQAKVRTPRALFEWERDFPKHLQGKAGPHTTILDFEFSLTTREQGQFKKAVNVNLQSNLPVRLAIDSATMELTVRRQGGGYKTLNERRARVARFVAQKIRVEHVESVRTVDAAIDIVNTMVEEELAGLTDDAAYVEALRAIEVAQRPVLQDLSSVILRTLRDFLPDVQSVRVEIPREDLERALASVCRVIVDDGTATDLKFKGDGVKSLAALALVRKAAERLSTQRELVLAIEEPEAHLHPLAVHGIRRVLHDIASKQQVVVTTHSPLLVDRGRGANNIIVNQKRAYPAPSVKELREVLGVRLADNLQSAELALVVEGPADEVLLGSILREKSAELTKALDSGRLAIEVLSGAGNLSAKLTHLRSSLCEYHVFLDHDDSGRAAFEKASAQGLLSIADQQFAMVPGMKDSELEDMLDPSVYTAALANGFGVDVRAQVFRSGKARWSARMAALFKASGKPWDDNTCRVVKAAVAQASAVDPAVALHPQRAGVVDVLISRLTSKLAAS